MHRPIHSPYLAKLKDIYIYIGKYHGGFGRCDQIEYLMMQLIGLNYLIFDHDCLNYKEIIQK